MSLIGIPDQHQVTATLCLMGLVEFMIVCLAFVLARSHFQRDVPYVLAISALILGSGLGFAEVNKRFVAAHRPPVVVQQGS